MLNKKIHTEFISINYPYTGGAVRFHKHSEDGSL